MRHYEVVFLVHPDQSELVPAMIDRYKALLTNGGGTVHRLEDWGRRQLAFMIDGVYKAHYVLMNIECDGETLAELTRMFKFSDAVIRNLVIRKDKPITEASVLALEKVRENVQEESTPEPESKGIAKLQVGQDDGPILAQAETEPDIPPASEEDIASEAESEGASELDESKADDDADSDKEGVYLWQDLHENGNSVDLQH